ncbi:condensation domain-containing protein [Micromonospora sp. NPDC050695]|uniref:condensation domain-containing protein n=1 Tax=Micromonospora sp. NPDC050695 TaxID=3154938 RepID=UPI0033F67DAE
MQQGIWVLDTDERLRPTYLIPSVLEFAGRIDHQIFVDAVRHVVSRHPALRSRFRLNTATGRVEYRTDGEPGHVGFIDARAEGWTGEKLDHLVEALCWTPFDLAHEAQVRAEVIKVDENRTLLVLTMHHISFDGWSRNLLVPEIATVYRAFLAGEQPALAAPVHPADVPGTVRQQRSPERVAQVLERLRGAPMTVDLPYDRPPAAVEAESIVAENLSITLDHELSARVLAVAGQEGCTPFMTAVAVLAGTLCRMTGQRDFLIAFGWPGRDDPATSEAIGMYMATLMLRVTFDHDTTWRDLLRITRRSATAAFVDSDVPLDAIAAALNPGRRQIWPPLTPILVNVDDLPARIELTREVSGHYWPLKSVYGKYDFDLFVRVDRDADGDRITFALDFLVELFNPATIESILGKLRQSAAELANAPEEKL